MPPTLFQLPNLFRPVASKLDQATVGTPQQTGTVAEDTAVPEAGPNPDARPGPNPDARQGTDYMKIDSSKIDSSSNIDLSSARRYLPTDWVETVRSNRTVIGLCFAVGLAVLFVGYRSEQRAEQAKMKTTEESQLESSEPSLPAAFASSLNSPDASADSSTASDSSSDVDESEFLTVQSTPAGSQSSAARSALMKQSTAAVQSADVPPSLKESRVAAMTVSTGTSRINPYAVDASNQSLPEANLSDPLASGPSYTPTNQAVGFDLSTESMNASLGAPHVTQKHSMPEAKVQSPRYPQTPTPEAITDWSAYLPPAQ